LLQRAGPLVIPPLGKKTSSQNGPLSPTSEVVEEEEDLSLTQPQQLGEAALAAEHPKLGQAEPPHNIGIRMMLLLR
jgi:hypothetical protein